MRGFVLTFLLSLTLLLPGVSGSATPGSLHIRRAGAAGARSGVTTLTPEALRAIDRARVERWRGWPDCLSAEGFDWSQQADRRSGFTARAPLRTSHLATTQAALSSTPPKTLHVAFIRIEFENDRGGAASSGDGRFDLSGPDTTAIPIDRPPHNRDFYTAHHVALERFYDAQSYHRVVITGEVWPRTQNGAYRVSDMADFGPWAFGQSIYGAAVHMFQTFLDSADVQSQRQGDRIPWDQIDCVVLIHAGSDLQSDLRRDSKEDIPSFTIGVADSDAFVAHDVVTPGDSVVLTRASFIPETINQDGYFGTLNGVIAHECGHLCFGFADLYDVETGLPTVGLWSLMDSGNLAGTVVEVPGGDQLYATGLVPPSVDPFQRFFIGDALSFPEVAYGDTMTLMNGERHPDMRSLRMSTDEYLLIENRWISPDSVLSLDQDSTTRVILGPNTPDRYEYDALLPGPGMLIWQIDESVIPFTTSLRPNPDFGFNTNAFRPGISVVEADGLKDLGDVGSPYLLGSYRDPWYIGNNTRLSDDTRPPLVAHTGQKAHARLEVFSYPDSTMKLYADRSWAMTNWPVPVGFPDRGPELLAIDADGDHRLDVCWAGADSTSSDSTSLWALNPDGTGNGGPSPVFASLDRRPFPLIAAVPTTGPTPYDGPALFAATTFADGPTTATPGGRVWLIDHVGDPVPGWPVTLPAIATTPPVLIGAYPNTNVLVGCADGRVYALRLDGTVRATSTTALAGGITGRLAVVDQTGTWSIAAGGAAGDVEVLSLASGLGGVTIDPIPGWPQRLLSTTTFNPDFLWLDFDGGGGQSTNPSGCARGTPELVVHHLNRLWAFCEAGTPLAGWGRTFGDTIVAGLGAGDADGDGFPEVLVQSYGSQVAFINVGGYPSPGWPRMSTAEGRLAENPDLTDPRTPQDFPTLSPPLALDVAGEGHPRLVALNTSGIVVALDANGKLPAGWPLGSGSGTGGAPLAADLDHDGVLELIVPDRFGNLYGYHLPGSSADPARSPWAMTGGDPGRTSSLPASRTGNAPAASAGPYVGGSLMAYPNPARRRPVSFAWRLTEPADVEFSILDSSGHQVASFHRQGVQSDNVVVWEPGALPAGLYLAHVRFRGAKSDHVETIPVGVLR